MNEKKVKPWANNWHGVDIPIPLFDAALKTLLEKDFLSSWVLVRAHLNTGSDVSPGFDFVAHFEDANGMLSEMRVLVGIQGHLDAPRIIQDGEAVCKLSVFWNEKEVVNRVLLSFKSSASLAGFFSYLVSAFDHVIYLAMDEEPSLKEPYAVETTVVDNMTPKERVFETLRIWQRLVKTADLNAEREKLAKALDNCISWESELENTKP